MNSDEKDIIEEIEFNFTPLERAAKDHALKAVNKIEDCHPCDALWLEHHIELAFLAGAEWAEKQSKWIKCSERLPPINQDESGNNPHLHEYMQSERVLAWLENPDIYDSHVFTGRFVSVLREKHLSRHEQWFEGCSEGSVSLEEVTHWMPLPEAPKEEGE